MIFVCAQLPLNHADFVINLATLYIHYTRLHSTACVYVINFASVSPSFDGQGKPPAHLTMTDGAGFMNLACMLQRPLEFYYFIGRAYI